MTHPKKEPIVLVIHGPNLNTLGTREPEVYGKTTLADIDRRLEALGKTLGIRVESFQSNHEGAIVEKIQESRSRCRGVVINPAAYTHTSVAIRDALLLLDVPVVEVHLSNIDKREPFRHRSMIADVVAGRIAGFGAYGYEMALCAVQRMVNEKKTG